jgi:thiol-disulfide isomerase/thioredoxin
MAWLGAAAGGEPGPLMPEFGPSVKFEASTVPFRLGDVRGKTVLVLFYQSWCPKCNAWSGPLFQQITEAHGKNRAVVLTAIKTDGGKTSDAMAYLKERGVDTSKWHVATDDDAAYYSAVTSPKLYRYALVGPGGRIAETAEAGRFYNVGGKQVFTLARDNLVKKAGGGQALLPKDKAYPPGLALAVKAAEVGNLGLAYKLGRRAMGKPSLKESAHGFLTDMFGAVRERIEACGARLESGEGDSAYDDYCLLRNIASEVGSTKTGKEAKALADKLRESPAVRKEAAAEKRYNEIWAKAASLKPEVRRPALAKALGKVAKQYPDTRYGAQAAKLAEAFSK